MCRNCIGVEIVAVLGGDYDGDDLLSAGVDMFRGPTGRTYVHDFGAGASEIFFYRPDGELEFIIRRRGEGPGEFVEPTAIVEMPGGQLAVFRSRPGVGPTRSNRGMARHSARCGRARLGGFHRRSPLARLSGAFTWRVHACGSW